MKKPSKITIYSSSKWLVNVCNENQLLDKSKKLDNAALFKRIDNELSKHNYKFILVRRSQGIYGVGHFQSLVSRARQRLHQLSDDKRIEYIPYI